MKRTLLFVWLLVPVAIVAWHYGPGQAQYVRDLAGRQIRQARAAVAEENWDQAAVLYAEAAAAVPEVDVADRRRLQLAEACSRIRAGEMIKGQEQLEAHTQQLEAARRAFEAARDSYVAGVGPYLSVLTSLSAHQEAELLVLQSERALIRARLQLHQALGGPWTRGLGSRAHGG